MIIGPRVHTVTVCVLFNMHKQLCWLNGCHLTLFTQSYMALKDRAGIVTANDCTLDTHSNGSSACAC